ncbi:hypothetical protein [Streptomyces sp. NPDC060366]|uniref:hypothetical protein n=1 Tax=Streptomyces sp. NPDC060366 TaxID=3347105 RepID=UPI00365EC709
MPLIPVTCVTVACDVCPQKYEPDDYSVHFDDDVEAREIVRSCGWLITTEGRVICDADDAGHRQAVDDLLPALPMPGQLALGESRPDAGR